MPIVEPEVLLDGEHGIDRTLEVAEQVWAETFKYMADNKVMFEGILLKPSMVCLMPPSNAIPPCNPLNLKGQSYSIKHIPATVVELKQPRKILAR